MTPSNAQQSTATQGSAATHDPTLAVSLSQLAAALREQSSLRVRERPSAQAGDAAAQFQTIASVLRTFSEPAPKTPGTSYRNP